MSNEWVYLVNEHSKVWGYDVPVLDFFLGARDPGGHNWFLSRRLRDFAYGDLIWFRASAPVSAFVGLGQVASELEPRDNYYTFDVLFDAKTCADMAAAPIPGIVEKRIRAPRRLTVAEAGALHAAVGGSLPNPPIPPSKVRRQAEVVVRQGQADFRAKLLNAYERRCAITGTNVVEALQAAHIEPYDGAPSNVLTNGLLLRADIHNLFDSGLIWVTDSFRIALDESLRQSEYAGLRGKKLKLPKRQEHRPASGRFARHRTSIARQPN